MTKYQAETFKRGSFLLLGRKTVESFKLSARHLQTGVSRPNHLMLKRGFNILLISVIEINYSNSIKSEQSKYGLVKQRSGKYSNYNLVNGFNIDLRSGTRINRPIAGQQYPRWYG